MFRMAISHDEASAASRALCESLFAELSRHLAGLTRGERGGAHVFAVPGRPQLTWVYHRKTLAKVEIWPYFDHKNVELLHSFVTGVGLALRPRKAYKGIGRLYPLPMNLVTQEDVGRAVKVLLFAHEAQREIGVEKAGTASISALKAQIGEGFSEGSPKTITYPLWARPRREDRLHRAPRNKVLNLWL